MPPIERLGRYAAEIDAIEASHVDVDLVGIRPRYVKTVDAADAAEVVRGDAGVESVGSQLGLAGEKLETIARDDPVQKSLLFANRAVARDEVRQIRAYSESHAPAVTAPFVSLLHVFGHTEGSIADPET